MFEYSSRRTQAKMIWRSLRGNVPDDLLRTFVRAVAESDEPPPVKLSTVPRSADRRLVYGAAWWGPEEMVILPFRLACKNAMYWVALQHSRTWGEFLNSIPWSDRGAILTQLRLECWSQNFIDHYKNVILEEPEASWEQAWNSYLELDCVGRRPLDQEEFCRGTIEELVLDNPHMGPPSPSSCQAGTVPPSISRVFGTTLKTQFLWAPDDDDDAPTTEVQFRMSDAPAIVAALHALRYPIYRDDCLVGVACSAEADPHLVMQAMLGAQWSLDARDQLPAAMLAEWARCTEEAGEEWLPDEFDPFYNEATGDFLPDDDEADEWDAVAGDAAEDGSANINEDERW